jgi:hypothetical protein
MTITSTPTDYSISFKASNFKAAIGSKLGILLKNVADSASWLAVRNVRLTNSDPTIVDLPNYSFEQPDSGKINGWDNDGLSTGKGLHLKVPGWTDDSLGCIDSGIDPDAGTEGYYEGYLMGADPAIYDVSSYVIKAHDILVLRVDCVNGYQGGNFLIGIGYYDAADTAYKSAHSDTVATPSSWATVSLTCKVDSFPSCIGYPAAVYLKNASPTAGTYNNAGGWIDMDNVRLNNYPSTAVSVHEGNGPTTFSLSQNYPNPFNPSTKITYSVKSSGKVSLVVYDVLGREVSVLVNGVQKAGNHQVTFSGSNLASGIYFYRLESLGQTITKKMVLMK